MIRIGLFCAGGMSTSMLVKKIRQAAESKGIEVEANAYADGMLETKVKELDVAFLAPQVFYQLDKAKGFCSEANIEVEMISTIDYGMMNGEKILNRAIELSAK